jgi:large subunit ribosomal protein L28
VFKPNLLKKRFYIPDEDRWVVLKVSAKGLKVIDKIGITAALKRSEALGLLH